MPPMEGTAVEAVASSLVKAKSKQTSAPSGAVNRYCSERLCTVASPQRRQSSNNSDSYIHVSWLKEEKKWNK